MIRTTVDTSAWGIAQASGGETASLQAEVGRLRELLLQQELVAIRLRADASGVVLSPYDMSLKLQAGHRLGYDLFAYRMDISHLQVLGKLLR